MQCQANGCANKPGMIPRKIGLSFHRFPKDPGLRQCWEKAVVGENWEVGKWEAPQLAFLCSEHFHESDFIRSGKLVRLNKGAVPSIFSTTGGDERLEQLAANVDRIVIDENSNTSFCNDEASGIESMTSNDYSHDSIDFDTPLNERIASAMKKLTQNSNMKFMENFDPERSNRERRKLSRKIYTGGKKQAAVYDDRGHLISSGKDVCDCMVIECPGCHFPCPRCQSPKCGHECRVNRKWTYECVEIEGTDKILIPAERIFRKDS